MSPIISIKNLNKTYKGGFKALSEINLEIQSGEIFALLGPNGAGKTTLIGIICGIVNRSSGEIRIQDLDILENYRAVRKMIGLVPQELTTDAFETVWNTVSFSRGLFGLPANPQYIERVLRDLSLWEKRNNKLMTLSGGMKRRVMIAKALSHEPKILFLDEPTAGVDVELRKGMWDQIRRLRSEGVTIILTTHYIGEAEEMADRIGVINSGRLILTENKSILMKKLGTKELILDLKSPIGEIPGDLNSSNLRLENQGSKLIYTYDSTKEDNGISELLEQLNSLGVEYNDLNTKQSSLEDIFVKLVRKQ